VRGLSLERGIAQQRQISSLIKPRRTFIGTQHDFSLTRSFSAAVPQSAYEIV
jgi:hypothetical protein